MQITKLSIVKKNFDAGRLQDALRVAARFPQLGKHRDAIVSAHEAYAHPAFYKQLGRDIEALKLEGKKALIDRFGFNE